MVSQEASQGGQPVTPVLWDLRMNLNESRYFATVCGTRTVFDGEVIHEKIPQTVAPIHSGRSSNSLQVLIITALCIFLCHNHE